MSTIQIHKAFWGPIAELIERARLVSKGMNLSSEKMTDRLVRYYSANGVLDKPDRLGRDAAYNYRHLLQLLTARRLSEKGVSLEIIGRHNLTTTTERLETDLLSPIQTAVFAAAPKPEGRSAKLNKSFSGSPVAMVDLLSEVQAIKDQFTQDRQELRFIREEFGHLASNLHELGNGVAEISKALDSVAQLVKSGLNNMYQSEEKFAYMLEKQLSSYGEKFNYLAEGVERVERTLLNIEISTVNGKEK
jgi:DNA-binding transcriptional MerR regulator